MPLKSFQCDDWYRLLVIVVGYALTMLLSGYIVRLFAGSPPPSPPQTDQTDSPSPGSETDTPDVRKATLSGAVIGKCENFLALTFVLSGQLTALALVFTAKSIVRLDVIKKDPQYYLGGTLVNLCFSILMGYLIRFLLP